MTQQRKLHVRAQYLHLGAVRLLPPRLSRTESSGGQARAQGAPIESAHRNALRPCPEATRRKP